MYYKLLTKKILPDERTKVLEYNDFKIYWEGFLFIKGVKPGKESIKTFIDKIKETPITQLLSFLSGTFGCIVYDKSKDIIYTFSDNKGLFNIFYSTNYISTSFLESIKLNQYTKSDIDPIRIADFILTNSCFKWNTFFPNLNKLHYKNVIIDNGKDLKFQEKKLNDIFQIQNADNNIIKKFKPIVQSLRKMDDKILVDLSSGFDTRMVNSILDFYNLDYETGISGTPNCLDVILSKKLAEIIGKKHNIILHKINGNSLQKELADSFLHWDGTMDIIKWHRLYQYQKYLVDNDFALNISSMGGELYKGERFWWFEHGSNRSDIKDLINANLNIRYALHFKNIPHEIFSRKYQNYTKSYKERIYNYLEKTYDNDTTGKLKIRIYYEFVECSSIVNLHGNINRYDILFDRDLLPCGLTLKEVIISINKTNKNVPFIPILIEKYQLPWGGRRLFEKKIITYLNKKIARIKTNNIRGKSASSTLYGLIKDYINQLSLSLRRRLDLSIYFPPSIDQDLYPLVRSLDRTHEIIELLQNAEILKSNIKVESIPNNYLGTLYTIGKHLKFIESIN